MIIDKPLVSILLAVYKPNENWLIEQLISLNKQNYENLNLYVYDDCPEYPTNTEIFNKYITNFEYKIIRGEVNKGSNKAFEELTKIADGEFFAYCDQDDIWETNKISLMMDEFTEDVTLVCCDLSIIDENSNKTHESLCDIRKRIVYKSGYNLAKGILVSNFVTGCAMIVKRNIAIKSIPFARKIVHDNWIAVVAALNGKIKFLDKQLIKYRQHNNNQTGILKGIYNKKTYYNIKIVDLLERYLVLKDRLTGYEEVNEYIDYCITSLQARKEYFMKPSINQLKIMIKYSRYYKISIILEIFSPIIPECLFKVIIGLTKKGIL
ncbi:glycosyltransferase [Clostridium sp.]|uniref:glycosyltransferase n=1 Tax=Clostridium sp. TaxID=1506 RepID=UPI00257AE1BE|nr:glycosyltransferase [Clostridium sp.]MDU7261295.1 glycosyltransferase [Clostridium butyricum]MBS4842108.1 glycosyltransferase [Clostridium sp.]MDU1071269.1 glycosyltransferase [Clostridium sp.]MDU2679561.1 glycosyltransferase [Clostridium sp.]MDU4214116.1 glycosyltransferase [Clostridium sp.]